MELLHLHISRVVKDDQDAEVETTNPNSKQNLLMIEYPMGAQGEIEEVAGEANAQQTVGSSKEPKDDADPSLNTIAKVEINNLSCVVYNGKKFVFLHDLERALNLRMDECLAILCTKAKFLLDNSTDPLKDNILPLGNSALDTVILVNKEAKQHAQKLVPKSEFLEVHAMLLADHTILLNNVLGEVDYPPIVEKEKSSINLDSSQEHDAKQVVV